MTYASEVLADSPVFYLHLDETSGTSAADAGSNGAAWTYQSGVTLGQTGLIGTGTSITCPGTTAGVLLTSVPASLVNPTAFTLECVVNLPNTSQNGKFCGVGAALSGNGYGFGVGATTLASSGNNLVGVADAVAWMPSGVAIGTGTHHVAMSRDAAGWYFYIDGALVKTLAPGSIISANGQCNVGGNYPTNYLGSANLIDEVAMYATALSSTRIAAHYAAISGGGGGGTPRTFREPAPLRRQAIIRASSY